MEGNQSFRISARSLWAIQEFSRDLLDGYVAVDPWGPQYGAKEYAQYAAVDAVQALSRSEIIGCTHQTTEKLRCAMENIALALSKTFRDTVLPLSSLNSTQGNSTATGQALSNMTYVSVRWQWAILPALVWLSGLITLLGTMLKNRKVNVPKWKNDIMPLLYLYGDGQHEKLEGDQSPVRVRLDKRGDKIVFCE